MGTFTCRNSAADIVVPPPPPPPENKQPAGTLNEIRNLLAGGESVYLTNDIDVTQADCDGAAVLNLNGISGLSLCGEGYKIRRVSGQAQCSLVVGDANTKNFTFDNVAFEEVPGPETPGPNDYPRMLHFVGGCNICLDGVTVAHSWGYAIYTNGVMGFKFKESCLENSGALGLYIGHTQGNADSPTVGYEILNSKFDCNTTNALAILGGVNGVVKGNTFTDNHKLGIFPLEPEFGVGFTGGGQVYIAEADFLEFCDNTITDGFCQNCSGNAQFPNQVTGLELGLPNAGTTVTNMKAENNIITNNTAHGVSLNSGATLDSTTIICDSALITGNGNNINIPAANHTP